jgi:hypothetical protein
MAKPIGSMIARIFVAALALIVTLWLPYHEAAAQVTQPRTCSKSAFVNNITTPTTTQVAPSVNQSPFTASPTIGGTAPLTTIYICGYTLIVGTTSTAMFQYGVGLNCAGTPTTMSITYPAGTYIDTSSIARGFEVPAGNVVCLTTTGAGPTFVQIYYDNNPL